MIRPLDTGFREDVDARARSLMAAAVVIALVGSLAHRLPFSASWRAWLLAPFRPALVLAGGLQSALVDSFSGREAACGAAVARTSETSLVERSMLAARAASLERELNQLRSTIDLPAVMPVRGTVATVTVGIAGTGGRTLLIDKGTAVDVKIGSIVMAAVGDRAAVVGRVVEAGPTVAKVMTVLDPACRVSASLRGASGYVFSGAPDRELARLEFVPRDQEVAAGDEIVTSEDGTIFPEGLLLGRVKSIEPGGTVFHEILVEPAVSMEHLRYVWVTRPGNAGSAKTK